MSRRFTGAYAAIARALVAGDAKARLARHGYVVLDDAFDVALTDAAGLVGREVEMPNAEWGARYGDGGTTAALVLAFAAAGCSDGANAYVCRAEGHDYIFQAAAVVRAAGGGVPDGERPEAPRRAEG